MCGCLRILWECYESVWMCVDVCLRVHGRLWRFWCVGYGLGVGSYLLLVWDGVVKWSRVWWNGVICYSAVVVGRNVVWALACACRMWFGIRMWMKLGGVYEFGCGVCVCGIRKRRFY